MQGSRLMGGMYAITEWVMKLSVINILWIITNLPVLFILFLMALTSSQSLLIVLGFPLALLLPILFVPGTIAVFATVRDWVMYNDQPSLVKGYWRHFKSNYKKSVLTGIGLTFLWVVWLIDYFYFLSVHDLFGFILIGVGVLLFAYTVIFFCMSVHYHMRKRELFKNSFYTTVGSPLLLVGIIVFNFLIVFISTRFWFLFPFFSISLSILLSFFLFYRFTLKVGKKVK